MSKRRAAAHQPHPDSPFAQSPEARADARETPPLGDIQESPTPSEGIDPDGDGLTDAEIDQAEREIVAAAGETPETPATDEAQAEPEKPETLIAGRTPAEAAQVLGQALVEQARNAADVEATERAYAGSGAATSKPRSPRVGHLPFGDTRFNADAAIRNIGEIAAEIAELKDEWETRKSLAADAKKAYDERVESLLKIIDRYQADQVRAAHQPTLRDVDEVETAPARGCPWEQANPGARCPICAAPRHEAPSTSAPEHPQHADHAAAAEARRVAEREQLQAALEPRQFYLTPAMLESLSDAELQTLVAWAQSPGVVPPPLMLRACVAGEPDVNSGTVQACSRCGRMLWARADKEGRPEAYPSRALVGLECLGGALDGAGDPVEGAAAAPEPARQSAKRGTRKKTAQHNPEAERAEQLKAGKAAAEKKPRGRRKP